MSVSNIASNITKIVFCWSLNTGIRKRLYHINKYQSIDACYPTVQGIRIKNHEKIVPLCDRTISPFNLTTEKLTIKPNQICDKCKIKWYKMKSDTELKELAFLECDQIAKYVLYQKVIA